jgi:hypothetical protein
MALLINLDLSEPIAEGISSSISALVLSLSHLYGFL